MPRTISLKRRSVFFCIVVATCVTLLFQPSLENKLGGVFAEAKALDKIVLIAALAALLAKVSRNRPIQLPLSSILSFLFLFTGLISVALHHPERIFYGILQSLLVMQGFITLIAFANLNWKRKELEGLISVFLILGTLTIFFGLLEAVYPNQIKDIFHDNKIHETAVTRGNYQAVQSIFGHPGLFGWYMAFCFCISLPLAYSKRSTLLALLSALFFAGVVLSLRRRPLIACLICGVLLMYLYRKQIPKLAKGASLLIIAALIIYITQSEKTKFLFDSAIESYSFTDTGYSGPRVALTKTSIEIANDSAPFGSGFSTFGSWMSRVAYSPLYQQYKLSGYWGLSEDDSRYINDTFWPMIIAETGWFGLLLYGGLLISIVKRIYRVAKSTECKNDKVYFCIALLITVELIIESVASPALSRSPQTFFVMMIVGICFSMKAQNKEAKNPFPQTEKTREKLKQ